MIVKLNRQIANCVEDCIKGCMKHYPSQCCRSLMGPGQNGLFNATKKR